MDDHRAQTLQALETFIQTQKNLLARQRSDLDRLHRLRVDFVQRPSQVLTKLGQELDDNAFKLSEQADCRLKLPKDIDWSVFAKSDIGPLQAFSQRNKFEISQRSRPSLVQRSELSELQRFVKQAKRTILDPILSRFADMSSPEPESEDEIDPVELKRQQEQQKIRELKKRQIRSCGLSLPLSSISGSIGVFIRPDVDDEAMNVDITIDDDADTANNESSMPAVNVDSDTPSTSQATSLVDRSPSAAPRVKATVSGSGPRVRRPSKKAISQFVDDESVATLTPLSASPRPRKKVKLKLPSRPVPSDDDDSLPDETEEPKAKKRRAEKPKPETYKQAWSESEQNLLEQLLEEIPDGEKNRWQKISKAMGGRRTPRQVASRVQKYFEKLKRFGIGVDGGAG
ncbi:hypothetical protein GALMADRAFT_245970 [Galerina marginata CBS 339.88]|uniref:Uncharacterized protein n=1 Tax=Galerina marginata (strain CBS 339.88) TaxID=685588 RepID=A0A067T112_GALM3|nr:hypothetical protein GALMADRAFT_245970 [Galerina marginata CBS 339.88]